MPLAVMTRRKLKHFLRFQYPVTVVADSHGFVGIYPDLPGCRAYAATPAELYALLDTRRRHWLQKRIIGGDPVPLPNSCTDVARQLELRRCPTSPNGIAANP